jgi:hypothetical protein
MKTRLFEEKMIKESILVPLNMSEILMRRLIGCLYGIHYNQFPEEYENDIRHVIDVMRGEKSVDEDLKAVIDRLRAKDDDIDETQDMLNRLKWTQFIRRLYRRGKIVETESSSTEGLRNIVDLVCSNWMPIDEFFAIEAVSNIDPLAERFMELRAIFIHSKPPEEAREHLIEATQCYLQGFYQASIIICRSVVEYVLDNELEKKGQPTDQHLYLIVDNARKEKIIDSRLSSVAHSLRKAGRDAIHRKRLFLREDALKYLEDTKNILQHVYGP